MGFNLNVSLLFHVSSRWPFGDDAFGVRARVYLPFWNTSTEMSKDHAPIEMDLVCESLCWYLGLICLINILFPDILKFDFVVLSTFLPFLLTLNSKPIVKVSQLQALISTNPDLWNLPVFPRVSSLCRLQVI